MIIAFYKSTVEQLFGQWQLLLLYGAAGAIALGGQTYLLRDFIVLLQGDEMAVGIGLAAWFVGIGLGALVARNIAEAKLRQSAAYPIVLLGALTALAMLAMRFGHMLLGTSPSELMSIGPALCLAGCTFLLPGACVGYAFVALASAANVGGYASHSAVGRLYVVEAIGSLLAGCFVSQGWVMSSPTTMGLGAVVGIGMIAALPAAIFGLIGGRRCLIAGAALGFTMALPPVGQALEWWTESARFAAQASGNALVAVKNTPYQRLTLGGETPRVLYANGQYIGSFPDPNSYEPLAHELMLFSASPSRVLSLGGLETGLLRHCLLHPVESLELVLMDRDALHFVETYLEPADRAALADPRVHVVFADPRQYLTRPGPKYDLVLALEPDPTTLLLARTTSIEFNRLVFARLAQDGVYVTRFSAGANVQSDVLGLLGASLHRTLRGAFPIVRATPGPDAFFVAGASSSSVSLDAEILEQRFRQRRIQSEVFLPELLGELLEKERTASINRELARSMKSAELARDDRPIAFLHALSLRQRFAGGVWGSVLDWASRHGLALAGLLLTPSLLVVLAACAGKGRGARPSSVGLLHAVAVTGACGLAASLLSLVSFQTRVGALYFELGTLNGVFMAGLALGGQVGMRFSPRRTLLQAQLISIVPLGFLAASLWALDHLALPRAYLYTMHGLLLLSSGVGTGIVFPVAARDLGATVLEGTAVPLRRIASTLELWDHLGAAAAAVLGALLLIPVLGLRNSAGLLVALQSLGLCLTWLGASKVKSLHQQTRFV